MFTLNLLGGAGFHGLNGPVSGRAAHRRRVALLAILSVARGRTVGREKIVGLLWPDLTAARARHLLSEALYVLRKELGADAFVSAGDEVGLNGDVVWNDVEAFEQAVEGGELERAAQLYRGPFRDGFFVSDAPEFERWAEGERARLAHAHARAVECLAATREGEGRVGHAAEWWRRLAVLDPYDSRVGMRLMRALDAAGQRAAALWFAETHTAFLREELGVEPEDELAELVERLRTEPVRVPPLPPAALVASTAPADPAASTASTEYTESTESVRSTASAESVASAASAESVESTASAGDAGDAGVDGEAGTRVEPVASGGAPGDPRDGEAGPAVPLDLAVGGVAAADVDDALTAGTGAPAYRAAIALCPGPGDMAEGVRADAGDGPAGQTAGGAAKGAGGEPRAEEEDGAAGVKPRDGAAGKDVRGGGRPLRPAVVVALAAVVAAVALAVGVLAPGWGHPAAARAAEPDPHRIAVLYFDDHSPGGELGYLANGLTEILIHQLGQVGALDVVPRNAVKAYRETVQPFDSLVADLGVGTLVEGSVQRSGDEVRLTVQLVDAATRSRLDSRTIVHPLGDVFALEDALADSVSAFLRRRLGQQVRLRRIRAETDSPDAWRWVMEAEQAREDAGRFLRAGASQDAASAVRALARADSLLARAQRADPSWTRPTVLRGWVAHAAAPLSPAPDTKEYAALAFAERALARAPDDARARELRGILLLARALDASDGTGQAERLDRAEADLRAAVAAEPGLARAWGGLSHLLRYRGRVAEADAATRRALAEDAYLEDADVLLERLFFSAMLVADYARADSACVQGGRRFPGDWRFAQCTLLLLRADPSRPPDAAGAVRLLAQLERLDPPARARSEGRAYSPVFRRAVAAAVVARAGSTDSARAMLARARREVASDAEMSTSLAYDAAYVHHVLGEPDRARALLAWAFTRRPEMRAFAARDPLFRGLSLPAP